MSKLTASTEQDGGIDERSRRSVVKDVICAVGMVAMLSHALLAIFLVPRYFLEHRPEAPISRFFAYCHLHCGGLVFWGFYFALLFGFFIWSILRYANLPKRKAT